jgi:hypothetical protein
MKSKTDLVVKRSLVDRLLDNGKMAENVIADHKLIDISQAAAQFHATHPVGKLFSASQVCHNVAPPFDCMVLESGCPIGLEEYVRRASVFVWANEPDDTLPDQVSIVTKWVLTFIVVVETRDKTAARLPIVIRQYVDANGKLWTPGEGKWAIQHQEIYGAMTPFDRLPVASFEVGSNALSSWVMDWFIAPTLFAISLMHCKNVHLRTR